MSWSPANFAAYRTHYPATPALDLPDPGPTAAFAAAWEDTDDVELDAILGDCLSGTTVVFARGFLGNWMPGNLVEPAAALEALGARARVARTNTGDRVEANVDRLAAQVPADGPLVLCGHSKGGWEVLRLVDTHPDIAARTRAVVLSQTPRGPSAVLESVLLREHRDSLGVVRAAEETLHRVGLATIAARPAGRQLVRPDLDPIVEAIDRAPRDVPVLQCASWSTTPTTWLDSFHRRLREIAPGVAHDGQFFLADLLWPGWPHVLLPQVDHAQPAVGGLGFPHVRVWKLLIAQALGVLPTR